MSAGQVREALITMRDELRIDDPHRHYDLVCDAIRAMDAARMAPAVSPDHHPDDDAVDEFAARLKRKLAASRAKGRSGWRDSKWTQAQINEQLHAHLAKGDPLDVAAYAMFLSLRDESTTAQAEQPKAEPVANATEAHRRYAEAFDKWIADDHTHWTSAKDAAWQAWKHLHEVGLSVGLPPAPAVPEGYTAVKTETLQWLLGERGDFVDAAPPNGKPRPYFWRSALRAAVLTPTPEPPK